MRAEARGLNLGRTSWHYDEVDVRPQRARPRLGGARVLARKLRGEPCPTFRRRAPRHGCQPCFRGSRLSSRVPSALSPSSPALAAHTLDEDSPAYGNVSRAGDDCGVVFASGGFVVRSRLRLSSSSSFHGVLDNIFFMDHSGPPFQPSCAPHNWMLSKSPQPYLRRQSPPAASPRFTAPPFTL